VDISHLSFWAEFSGAKRRKPVFFWNFVSGFGNLLEIRSGFLKENFGEQTRYLNSTNPDYLFMGVYFNHEAHEDHEG